MKFSWTRSIVSPLVSALCALGARAQCPFEAGFASNVASPYGVAAADLNGDGRIDFAVGQGLSAFSLALQSAHGAYPSSLPYVAVGGSSTRVARAARMDPDADIDLVFAGEKLVVARNDGSGGFPVINVYTEAFPYAGCMAVADLDLDGDIDVVTASPTASKLSVRLNDGLGNLGAASVISVAAPHGPARLEIALIDNDSIPDLVTGNGNAPAEISFYRGLGGGTFAAPVHFGFNIASASPNIVLGDITGDGKTDVVVRVEASGVYVLAGDGLGGFTQVSTQSCDVATRSLALADMDRDGKLDVVGGAQTTSAVQVFRNLGAGSLAAPRSFAAGAYLKDIECADINLDGAIDVACTAEATSELQILFGDGHGGLRAPERTSAGVSEANGSVTTLRHADLDLDGHEDLVFLARNTYSAPGNEWNLGVRRGLGGGSFDAATLLPLSANVQRYELCRLDPDNFLDLVVLDGTTPTTYLADGLGGFTLAATLASLANAVDMRTGDVTGDGLVDVVVTCSYYCAPFTCTDNRVGIYAGDGMGGGAAPVVLTAGPNPSAPAIADFDVNGLNDIVVCNSNDATRTLFRQTAPATYAATTTGPNGSVSSSAVFDINADNKLDLVTEESGGNGFARWYAGDGLGNFAAATDIGSGFGDLRDLDDLDGDGDVDFAFTDLGQSLDVWLNNGAGSFSYACGIPAGPGSVYTKTVLDIDGDGRMDLVVGTGGGACGIAFRSNVAPVSHVYCSAKTNSLGCVPAIATSGISSASASSGFQVFASNIRNQKVGLLFYSLLGRAEVPFQGGQMCVAMPRYRTPIVSSGGSASGNDCSGVYSIDMNAFAAGAGGGAPSIALSNVGTHVTAQWWGRDPGAVANTALSDAVEFGVGP